MSRILAELLGADEPSLNATLSQLESESGHPKVDVRILSDLVASLRFKMRELGLDPEDTNGEELYYALQQLAGLHDSFLARIVGSIEKQNNEELCIKLKELITKLQIPLDAWVIRQSVAKKLLKSNPPKKAMKLLAYKSIDSMLKRERVSAIYLATQLSESAAWQQRFIRSYKQLKPSDFEKRQIEILPLPSKKINVAAGAFVSENRHNIATIKELGTIYLLPLDIHEGRGTTLILVTMLLKAINEIRSFSSYLKLEQVKSNFGLTVAKAVKGSQPSALQLSGRQLPWQIIQQYLSGLKELDYPEILTPHLQAEDLVWSKPEDVLYRVEPALKFWQDMDWVAALHGQTIVPVNLIDNAISYCNDLPYGQHSTVHFQKSLYGKIYLHYLAQKPISIRLIDGLDYMLVGSRYPIDEEVFV